MVASKSSAARTCALLVASLVVPSQWIDEADAKGPDMMILDGGGGGAGGPTETISPAKLITERMAVRELGTMFLFDEHTKFQFPLLRELEYEVPEPALVSSATTSENLIRVSRVRASMSEELFRARVKSLRGEAVMVIERTGYATVVPKDETNPVIRALMDQVKMLSETQKGYGLDVERLSSQLGETNKRLDHVDLRLNALDRLEGFVYGVIAILGTSVVAAAVAAVKHKREIRRELIKKP